MSNQYLEKVAAGALKRYLASQNVTLKDNAGNVMSNSAVNKAFAGSTSMHSVSAGGMDVVPKRNLLGFKTNQTVSQPTSATRTTSDVLAGSTIQERLANKKAGNFRPPLNARPVNIPGAKPPPHIPTPVPKPGFGGSLLGKVTDFAKKNKVLTAAAGVGVAGLAAHKVFGNRNQNTQQNYGPQYGY